MSKPLAFLLLALVASAAGSQAAEVQDLRCESWTNPQGIDLAKPRLSWKISSDRRGDRQTAYQVLVASSLGGLGCGTRQIAGIPARSPPINPSWSITPAGR